MIRDSKYFLKFLYSKVRNVNIIESKNETTHASKFLDTHHSQWVLEYSFIAPFEELRQVHIFFEGNLLIKNYT